MLVYDNYEALYQIVNFMTPESGGIGPRVGENYDIVKMLLI